jgi:hypothetical protein
VYIKPETEAICAHLLGLLWTASFWTWALWRQFEGKQINGNHSPDENPMFNTGCTIEELRQNECNVPIQNIIWRTAIFNAVSPETCPVSGQYPVKLQAPQPNAGIGITIERGKEGNSIAIGGHFQGNGYKSNWKRIIFRSALPLFTFLQKVCFVCVLFQPKLGNFKRSHNVVRFEIEPCLLNNGEQRHVPTLDLLIVYMWALVR